MWDFYDMQVLIIWIYKIEKNSIWRRVYHGFQLAMIISAISKIFHKTQSVNLL